MLSTRRKNIVYLLLLLYIGYSAAVSYYIHPHIYRGIVYMHSHPYERNTNDAKEKQIPFEANHRHGAASFSTINQLSNLLSPQQQSVSLLDIVVLLLGVFLAFQAVRKPFSEKQTSFSLRAPPLFIY